MNDARTGYKGVGGIVEYLSYSLLDKLLRIKLGFHNGITWYNVV